MAEIVLNFYGIKYYCSNPVNSTNNGKNLFDAYLRKSKGRQKVPIQGEKQRDFGEDHAIVSPITRQHFVDRQREKKKKAQEEQKNEK